MLELAFEFVLPVTAPLKLSLCFCGRVVETDLDSATLTRLGPVVVFMLVRFPAMAAFLL